MQVTGRDNKRLQRAHVYIYLDGKTVVRGSMLQKYKRAYRTDVFSAFLCVSDDVSDVERSASDALRERI